MAIPLSNEIRALLDAPNFAHLATLMPDGSPQSVPIWVGREGDRILICTGEGSLKAKNTRRDPRVSLSIVDFHDPYQAAKLSRSRSCLIGGRASSCKVRSEGRKHVLVEIRCGGCGRTGLTREATRR